MDDDDGEVDSDSVSLRSFATCCFDFVIESFPQILMHGSSVSAFASRIMELQAKDFFSRFVCFLLLQIPPFIRDLSLLIAPVQ